MEVLVSLDRFECLALALPHLFNFLHPMVSGCVLRNQTPIRTRDNQMPFDPDIVVWKTLLAACKVHGNLEVGKRAAEKVLKTDPSNSAALVMLGNIHASSGHWNDLARLRSSMRQMDVTKVPGQSWIEIKDRVHVFLAEDSLHPERGRIYTMLEELMLQILDDSCDPIQMESFD